MPWKRSYESPAKEMAISNDREMSNPEQDLELCWWVFAVRGGLAVVFAVVLFLASSFLGIFFFDPVTLVYMSLLLGSFVLGNGLLLGVAAGFAYEHRLHLWWLALCESCFALLLGVYIGISLMLTPNPSLSWRGFTPWERMLSIRVGHQAARGPAQFVPSVSCSSCFFPPGRTTTQALSAFSLCHGILQVFLRAFSPGRPATTQALSGFELFCGPGWARTESSDVFFADIAWKPAPQTQSRTGTDSNWLRSTRRP
jgi:hypothetical protein